MKQLVTFKFNVYQYIQIISNNTFLHHWASWAPILLLRPIHQMLPRWF